MKDIKFPKRMTKRSSPKPIIKWSKRILIFFIVCLVSGSLFVKLNPTAAADFTDNYLRPLIGSDRVVFLENIFFNVSDFADGLIYKFKQPAAPQFLDQGKNLSATSFLDLTPIPVNQAFSPLAGEGNWENLKSAAFPDTEVMADTFIRPDPSRPFAIVSIVQIDTKLLRIGGVAGTKEPGGSFGNFGTGILPQDVLDNGSLVAAFNGGFLYNDGKYGMVVGNKTYAPLKNDSGIFVAYKDGTVKIFNYAGESLGQDVVFARQNGPLIIDNNTKQTLSPSDYKIVQGRIYNGKQVVPGATYTWRSGIGVTKKGNLLYAVGNNLSPASLADALQAAGAVRAMQLDINPSHVHFYIFNKTKTGTYDSIFLNKDLEKLNRSAKYFTGSSRDFFYLYKK